MPIPPVAVRLPCKLNAALAENGFQVGLDQGIGVDAEFVRAFELEPFAGGVLDAVGDRWAMLILRDLGLGLCRYDDLQKSTGVTHATLSDRLKHLEDNELIERRLYQTRPDRYEYALTRKGADIILVINGDRGLALL